MDNPSFIPAVLLLALTCKYKSVKVAVILVKSIDAAPPEPTVTLAIS
jgi:hypothetical protein